MGPASVLVVLGIELDSVNQSARLPEDKLRAVQDLIQVWRSRKWCTCVQLQSLIGHLHYAAKVVWPGRTFLRRMIDLLRCFRWADHPIRMNLEFHWDLQWWHKFLFSWHGVSFWLFPGMTPSPDLEVTSDAAGAIGYGAFFLRFHVSPVLGLHLRQLSPLHTKSFSQWFWQPLSGALNGVVNIFCSGLTMRQWYAS